MLFSHHGPCCRSLFGKQHENELISSPNIRGPQQKPFFTLLRMYLLPSYHAYHFGVQPTYIVGPVYAVARAAVRVLKPGTQASTRLPG